VVFWHLFSGGIDLCHKRAVENLPAGALHLEAATCSRRHSSMWRRQRMNERAAMVWQWTGVGGAGAQSVCHAAVWLLTRQPQRGMDITI